MEGEGAGIQVVRYEYSPRQKQNNHEISKRCLQVGMSFSGLEEGPSVGTESLQHPEKKTAREEPRHRVTRVFRGLSIQKVEEGSLIY